jgi:endonuclease/exonuclease/phosphatase family metal-dependent hydrolase
VKWKYGWLVALVGVGLYAAETIDFNVVRELNLHPKPPAANSAVRVVSWNIDRGVHLDVISSELKQEPADVLLLQEVDWNAARSGDADVAAELAHRLNLNMAYAIEFEELSQERAGHAYIGQATLSRFPIRRSRVLRFQRQSGFWEPHAWIPSNLPLMQRRLGSRIALVTDLDWNGKLVVVYNVHLESRSMGRIQAAQLDEMLADLRTYPAGTEAILGGDLNSKYFPSMMLHKLEGEGFHSALGERIERTHAIAMALDWIFMRGPFQWGAGAVRRDLKGSDHYPLYATLTAK